MVLTYASDAHTGVLSDVLTAVRANLIRTDLIRSDRATADSVAADTVAGYTAAADTAAVKAKPRLPAVNVLGVAVSAVDRVEALSALERLVEHGDPATVAFVNAHSINLAQRNTRYRAALGRTDLVLNDGAGLALAARLDGRRFADNLNGTDLLPEVLERAAARGWTVFFYGARPGVAEAAATRLAARIPGLIVAGTADGYTLTDAEAVDKIRASGADLLLVAKGNPAQELWLDEHLWSTGARLGIGVGAFLDFASGRVRRAPQWVRRLRAEWLYRLALEPKRMFRRYVVGNPLFLLRVARRRITGAR